MLHEAKWPDGVREPRRPIRDAPRVIIDHPSLNWTPSVFHPSGQPPGGRQRVAASIARSRSRSVDRFHLCFFFLLHLNVFIRMLTVLNADSKLKTAQACATTWLLGRASVLTGCSPGTDASTSFIIPVDRVLDNCLFGSTRSSGPEHVEKHAFG